MRPLGEGALVQNFLAMINDDEGATLVEYGLVVSLIAVACIVAMQTLSTNIQGTFDYIGTKLNGVQK
jgi:pilus assembly protein Flp/PilA